MRSRFAGAVLAVGCLVLASGARASDVASIAAGLPDEAAECRFLLTLCRLGSQAIERAKNTPSGSEPLDYKHQREADLQVRDANEAARTIAEKHGGKRLECFDDPACWFLER